MNLHPLVIGYPRSGFSLLINIISELIEVPQNVRTRSLKTLCDMAGGQIAKRIEDVFSQRGMLPDLVYNGNFRQLVGGPKWLAGSKYEMAHIRKYIGVLGDGDFTLITSHPREVLDYYEVIHSHVEPNVWPKHFDTPANMRFASMRHPVGTLTSACFSLNALSSEYIQRFIPEHQDNDLLRQRLALYKLTDLKFFEALLPPFKKYLEEFSEYESSYYTMRWEDLINEPLETISGIARHLNSNIDSEAVRAIWDKLDHVNLTGEHKHNLRKGHGLADGWKNWITNTHLEILKDHGFEKFSVRYGYGSFPKLDEAQYTPFQKTLTNFLDRGEIFLDYGDSTLFGFAFNKSNIDFSGFGFHHYPWRTNTCIERSSCKNESLVLEVSDVAEEACSIFNNALRIWSHSAQFDKFDRSLVENIANAVSELYDTEEELLRFKCCMMDSIADNISQEKETQPRLSEPFLLEEKNGVNIVLFSGLYYAIPQSFGPVDFHGQDLSMIPFLGIADSLESLHLILGGL